MIDSLERPFVYRFEILADVCSLELRCYPLRMFVEIQLDRRQVRIALDTLTDVVQAVFCICFCQLSWTCTSSMAVTYRHGVCDAQGCPHRRNSLDTAPF